MIVQDGGRTKHCLKWTRNEGEVVEKTRQIAVEQAKHCSNFDFDAPSIHNQQTQVSTAVFLLI
jgi:hypothetical protein